MYYIYEVSGPSLLISIAACSSTIYHASRLPTQHFQQIWLPYTNNGRCLNRGANYCKCTSDFPVQHMGKLWGGGISLIQRCESKIPAIKFLVLIHSRCPYKKCPQVLPVPPRIILFIISKISFFSTQCVTRANSGLGWNPSRLGSKLTQDCLNLSVQFKRK